MIILIGGASHTGKTLLAQKLIEKYKYPCLSIDHLKMGLIRSGNTDLTPMSDDASLTAYLWPIVREMIKTAIENGQNLIIEGCYIPHNWKESFSDEQLVKIKYICLIMSEDYIKTRFDDIVTYSNIIEHRLCCDVTIEELIRDNAQCLKKSMEFANEYYLIDGEYTLPFEF